MNKPKYLKWYSTKTIECTLIINESNELIAYIAYQGIVTIPVITKKAIGDFIELATE